jgi:gamma-tubulin complex component 2
MERGASELNKRAEKVNVDKLQALLDDILRQPGSMPPDDPFKEDVRVQLCQLVTNR